MSLTDNKGHTWAHKTTIAEGDILRTDGGFTCVPAGATVEIRSDPDHSGLASLYFDCNDGRHYLDGCVGVDGELVGLYVDNVYRGESPAQLGLRPG